MKYILDFDRTVFDMDSLYAEIERINPDTLRGTSASLEGIDLESLLFADALDFFAQCDLNNIVIISSCQGLSGQWAETYQVEKIQRSGVAKFVGEVQVVPTSKVDAIAAIAAGVSPVVYVDDHPAHILQAKNELSDIQTVHIDRQGQLGGVLGVQQISSLRELII